MQDEESKRRHALRGGMNAIKLGMSALELDLTKEERIEFLGHLADSADQMAQLIHDWLGDQTYED